MATRVRNLAWLVLLLLIVGAGVGCNLLSLPFFLLGPEDKQPPLLKGLTTDKKDHDINVVVLTYEGLETRPEFLRADRDLNNLVVKRLRDAFKANGEKVKIVTPGKVEEFKNTHPDWKRLDLADIGKHFDADYVIYIEIGSLSLYQPGSGNTLYHGRAELTLNLVDVNKADDGPESKEVCVTYPSDSVGGLVAVDEKTPQAFKAEFYDRVATQVAWHFTSHLTEDDYRLNN
jgi:hypothetical protein